MEICSHSKLFFTAITPDYLYLFTRHGRLTNLTHITQLTVYVFQPTVNTHIERTGAKHKSCLVDC